MTTTAVWSGTCSPELHPCTVGTACWNGLCAANQESCPCSPAFPYRCRTNGQCYASAVDCPCTDPTLVRCANATNQCAAAQSACPAAPTSTCSDGTSATAFQINAVAGATYSAATTIPFGASIIPLDCGVAPAVTLPITWTVANSSGTPVYGPVTSSVITIPPRSLPPGAYTVTAKSVDKRTHLTSIVPFNVIDGTLLGMVGGTDRVAHAGQEEVLSVTGVANGVSWTCCVPPACTPCPSAIVTAINVAGSRPDVVLPASVPSGTYLFYASTATAGTAPQRLVLLPPASPSPSVTLITSHQRAYTGDTVRAFARTTCSECQVQWYFNGVADPTRTGLAIGTPAAATANAGTLNVTVVSGGTAVSTVLLPVLPRPAVHCSVAPMNGATSVTALSTNLVVMAGSNGTASTDRVTYAFYYRDPSQAASTTMPISADYQSSSKVTLVAPMVPSAAVPGATAVVPFVVSLSVNEVPAVATAMCSVQIQTPTTAATTLASQRGALLSATVPNSDADQAVRAAQQLLALPSDDRVRSALQVLLALQSLVGNGTTTPLTRGQASAIIALTEQIAQHLGTERASNAAAISGILRRAIPLSDPLTDGPSALSTLSLLPPSMTTAEVASLIAGSLSSATTNDLGVQHSLFHSNTSLRSLTVPGGSSGNAMVQSSTVSLTAPSSQLTSSTARCPLS